MENRSTRRILLLGRRDAGALDIVRDLTGSAPDPDPAAGGSTAGLTHDWAITTPYYATTVSFWIDEFTDIATWQRDFLLPEAREVVEAVGAWVYVFEKSPDGRVTGEHEEVMRCVKAVVERHAAGGEEGDGEEGFEVGGGAGEAVLLAVAMPPGDVRRQSAAQGKAAATAGAVAEGPTIDQEEEEDVCLQHDFIYVDYGNRAGKNQFGEKVGFARLKEALETNEWPTGGAGNGEGDEDDASWLDDDIEYGALSSTDRDEVEWTAEMFGVKAALQAAHDGEDDGDDDDDDDDGHDTREGPSAAKQAEDVDDLDRLLGRLMAVKEQSAGLPEEERKRRAAQAVRDVMKEI